MGVDASFASGTLLAQYKDQIVCPETFFSPGNLILSTVVPKDPQYGAITAYDFAFTPSTTLATSNTQQIVIEFPTSLSFASSTCSVTSKSEILATKLSCQFKGQQAILKNIFKTAYTGGIPITLSISSVKNPLS
jgi:hypothetical protein